MRKITTDHDRARDKLRDAIAYVENLKAVVRDAQGYRHGDYTREMRTEDNCTAWLEKHESALPEFEELFDTKRAGE